MNTGRLFAIVCALTAGLAVSVPMARADESNQATQMTFSQAVEIPGQVLPAGTYLFVISSSDYDRNLVQIFTADRSKLLATLQTVSAERRQPARETILAFAERPSNMPEAILTWFYPGDATGHEFIYSKTEERELSQDMHHDVLSGPGLSGYAGAN